MDKISFDEQRFLPQQPHEFSRRISYTRLVQHMMAHTLTERQREMMTMHYMEHKSMTEIANLCGVNKSTVSRTIKRAVTKLRTYLNYE